MTSLIPTYHLDAPVLAFGGPYGNLQATRALFAEATRLGIPAHRMVCTGDLVAYGGDPVATIALMHGSGCLVVRGNCDAQLGAHAPDCACGYPEGSACERLAAAWFAHADAVVGPEMRAWLAQLPDRIDLVIGGRRLAVVHGTPRSMNAFVFASTPGAIKARAFDDAACDGIIAGHCGLPFTQTIGGRLWHNPGVVGLPAHDGTPRAWFSLITPEGEGLRIEHRALDYDHVGAAGAMRRAGLPEDYASALTTGIWPSCDVLPYEEIRQAGVPLAPGAMLWSPGSIRQPRSDEVVALWPPQRLAAPRDPRKFRDPARTATGEPRASVALHRLDTLWFNTGTVCNIACRNCYIESSPRNDRLAFLTLADMCPFLDEIEGDHLGTREIGFTGGEPFVNPHLLAMLAEGLERGFGVLVLTNGLGPMRRREPELLALRERFGDRLALRVSLDHYTQARHEEERASGTFASVLDGLSWLARMGFNVSVAGRAMWGEGEGIERAGYARLFATQGIPIDATDAGRLVLFPEMDDAIDVPEIGASSWGQLGLSPREVMCASSRMVVRRKGADRPAVLSCTLLPYEAAFELGASLREAARSVPLNHPRCAKFCVFGGASCATAPRPATSSDQPVRPIRAEPVG